MEIIRKKICLDDFRSHVNGALKYCSGSTSGITPTGDNMNFGGFVQDAVNTTICGWNGGSLNVSGETIIRATDMMRRYNVLLEILRHSIHLKHSQNLSCSGNGYYNKFYDDFNFTGTTDDFLFNNFKDSGQTLAIKVLFESAFTYNNNYYAYNGAESDVDVDYVILISDEDADIYNRYYGFGFVQEVHSIVFSGDTRFSEKPYIPINILLINNMDDIGLMSLYEDNELDYDVLVENDTKEGYNTFPLNYGETLQYKQTPNVYDWFEKSGFTVDDQYLFNKYKESPTPGTFSDENRPRLESRLTTLREKIYMQDDNGQTLPGIFEPLNGFYQATLVEETINEITRLVWKISSATTSNLVCADGEIVRPGEPKYRTQTIFETLGKVLDNTSASLGDTYYFLVKYNNGNPNVHGEAARIPYSTGIVFNKDAYEFNDTITYTGDMIINIDTSDSGYIEFTYVLGAIFSDNSYTNYTGGTIYNEKYAYKTGVEGTIDLDGFSGVSYWYNSIDFDGAKEQIINNDFNLTRMVNMSYINKMTTGDVWKQDETVYNSPVIKEDYLMGISMNGVTDIDVEINRGNTAAFESHFRLSECNSFDDIATNGNNSFFNIE